MIILNEAMINGLQALHGEPHMIPCYSEARGLSAITEQAILLLSPEKLSILYISKVSNRLIQKIEFNFAEISNSTVKDNLFLAVTWQFKARGQQWKFRIPAILPLKEMKSKFMECLSAYKYV